MINNYKLNHNINMKIIKKYNLLLFIPLLILNIISLLNMYNAKYINAVYNNALFKQLIWFIIGFLIIIIFKKLKIKHLFKYAKYVYLLSIILLFLVLIFGSTTNGAKCWLNFFGFSFQPSELAKIALSFYLAQVAIECKPNSVKEEFLLISKLVILTLIPSILVFLEPDTGAIINFLLILLVVILSLHLRKIWYISFIIIFITALIIFSICYIFVPNILIKLIGSSFFYRVDRIINFAHGNSYQLENALINISNASLFGVGLGKILLYIPEAPTDFILAFSTSNFGFISFLLILISYLLIDIYLLYHTTKIKDKLWQTFSYTYLLILFFHEFYNISMNLGLLPIMGIPLPFLSLGGTNTIINYIYLAIILNIFNHYKRKA